MGSERRPRPRGTSLERSLRALALASLLPMAACAHEDPRRFALRAPVLRDQDLDAVAIHCDPHKKPDECAPAPYESSFAWDGADNLLFRPLSEALEVKTAGDARNVNAFDEVPDSSWFVNRLGTHAMTPKEVFDGSCKPGNTLDEFADEPWLIDHGKDNGANPGFRVNVHGTKFMLKTDESQGERATAATAIATRLYYAAGWWAPCDSVVYFWRTQLKLKPGLTIKANTGPVQTFDDKKLDEILTKAEKRGGKLRAAASRWLPGVTIGPFTYGGTRDDDPSDVIPHESRRDLRGARVMAAWLNHFDAREQNTMSTWMPDEASKTPGHGLVRHWYIDLGDCFGSEWDEDGFSRRMGHAYLLDFGYVLEDFLALGIPQRPWGRARHSNVGDIFGYYSARDFRPDAWKGEYSNPAFASMRERDGAWAARIIARFTPEQIAAAVDAGDLTEPRHRQYLIDVLLARQRLILARYFAKVSPLTDVTLQDDTLCATDLARKTATFPEASFRYAATVTRAGQPRAQGERPAVVAGEEGKVCLPLPSRAPDGGGADDDVSRYVVARITSGAATGPLVLHFYDLGKLRGLRLVGIERPEEPDGR